MREKLARRRQRRIERGLSPDAPPTARVKSDRKRQRGKNRKARIRSKDWNEVAVMQLATREGLEPAVGRAVAAERRGAAV